MNTHSISSQRLPQDAANLETRFGLRVGAALSERSATPGHDVSERLRVAREQALARARDARAALPARQAQEASSVVVQSSGTLAMGGSPWSEGSRWWAPLASLAPLLLLVLGLILIDEWHDRLQTATVAEVDSALLSDDLPPDAYTDPGFSEFLKSPEQH